MTSLTLSELRHASLTTACVALLACSSNSKESTVNGNSPSQMPASNGGETADPSGARATAADGSQSDAQDEVTTSPSVGVPIVTVPWLLRGVGEDSDAWDCGVLGIEWTGLVSLPPRGAGIYSSSSCDGFEKEDSHGFEAPIPGTYSYEVTLFRGPFSDFGSFPVATRGGTVEIAGNGAVVTPIEFVFQNIPVEWAFAPDAGDLGCESIGVARVAFGFVVRGRTRSQVFACERGRGVLRVEAGTYEYFVELQNVENEPLYRWDAPQPVVIADAEPSVLPEPVFLF